MTGEEKPVILLISGCIREYLHYLPTNVIKVRLLTEKCVRHDTMDEQAIALNTGVTVLVLGFMLGEVAADLPFGQIRPAFAAVGGSLVAASLLGVGLSVAASRRDDCQLDGELLTVRYQRARDY